MHSGKERKVNKQVLGFYMNEDKVVLIKKTKPEFQKGKLNGVGGKVEEGETELEAMVREFEEETGVKETKWNRFGNFTYLDPDVEDNDTEVTLYFSYALDFKGIKTTTEEEVGIYELREIFANKFDIMFNAKYFLMYLGDIMSDPLYTVKIGFE